MFEFLAGTHIGALVADEIAMEQFEGFAGFRFAERLWSLADVFRLHALNAGLVPEGVEEVVERHHLNGAVWLDLLVQDDLGLFEFFDFVGGGDDDIFCVQPVDKTVETGTGFALGGPRSGGAVGARGFGCAVGIDVHVFLQMVSKS